MKKIPFFNYADHYLADRDQLRVVLETVLQKGAFILQEEVATFEKNLAAYLGVTYAIGVANCTDGLSLALRAAGLASGDEVILPSHTFVATAGAVKQVGGVPVPVECGRDHLLDPLSAERAITPHTRAIIPVQLNGRVCDMDAIQGIADQHGLLIIEDAAQALGARYKGKCAGTFGTAAALSFYPAKLLGCFGDGGMVITNDEKIAAHVHCMRDHGRGGDGVEMWGINSRLDNLQAAILDHKLKSYHQTIQRRRQLASLYHEHLCGISELALPPPPDEDQNHFDVFQNYEIEAEKRDELRDSLSQQGIGTLVPWGGTPLHQMRHLGFTQDLPYTDRLFERCLMIPMNTSLQDEDVTFIAKAIRAFYSR